MKNILKLLSCLIVWSSSITVFGQKEQLKTETDFMQCFYQALPDQGEEFKNILNKAEQKLIDLNYLKDGSGESYVALYQNIKNMFNTDLQDLGVVQYMMKVSNKIKVLQSENCMKAVFASDIYKTSKLSKMMAIMIALEQEEGEQQNPTEKLLEILDPADFTHDYYKMTTFTMIESMNIPHHDDSLESSAHKTENPLSEEEQKYALKIVVLSKDYVVVNDEKIAFNELRMKVVNHLKNNTSKSIFLVQTEHLVNDTLFTEVHNQITAGANMVRNHMAKKKYKRPFNELSEKQQEEFINMYPLNVKDIVTHE
ncbi:hypothetical protein KORDIASMS9_00298 [Kordia sp. SMS9]|uniref:hypothetical protein n=1 Tax=Kordia sp. SMS9 TaxID=2282170 RepID=UPI000E0D9538|nr:hypothetical protein [Kordia sp. SMS9]AXG68108.1 hypothetical protein KORDIASMS9_00298 [Kordia sp. SMS9]